MYQRRDRVVELLRQQLSELLGTLKDPNLAGIITITDVVLSRDMKTARVFYSVLGSAEEIKDTRKILDRSASYLHRRLRDRLSMKVIPFLEFRFDDTPARAQRVEEILDRIHREDQPKEQS